MYTAWEDPARCNMKPSSESSGRSSRAKGSGMIELNKFSAIEAKLNALIHWVNKRNSSYKLKMEQFYGKNENCSKRRTFESKSQSA